jgi:hypothetical protein
MGSLTLLNLNCYIIIIFILLILLNIVLLQFNYFVDVTEYSFIERAMIAQSVQRWAMG